LNSRGGGEIQENAGRMQVGASQAIVNKDQAIEGSRKVQENAGQSMVIQ